LAATGPVIPDGPFLGGEIAVVAIDDDTGHALAGLDPVTGGIRWTVQTDLYDGPIATTDDVILIHQNTPPGVVVAQPPPPSGVAATPPAPPVRSCPEPSTETSTNAGPIYCAYDRSTGQLSWSVAVQASVELDQFDGGSVDGQTLIVVPGLLALDAHTGAQLWAAARSPGGGTLGPVSDGFIVWGGQDDPTSALDTTDGEVVWTKPGSPAYDDVWAAGDGAVYVTLDNAIVAYELASGAERWRRPNGAMSLPWDVSGETIFAMWNNLEALSTKDGSTRWVTDYAVDAFGFPRMTGIASHGSVVIVGFGTVASGGD
jgi:hypothetical protein